MKKSLFVVLCAALVLTGTACSGEADNPAESTATASIRPATPDAGAETGKPEQAKEPVQQKNGKTLVTLSLLTPHPFLVEAEQKFEAAHPDIDIEIKSLLGPETEGVTDRDMDKFNNQQRTELLAGKGADIYMMEGSLMAAYASKNLLAKLDTLQSADPSFDKSQLFSSILDGVKLNGHLYGIPLAFTMDSLLTGDAEAMAAAGVSFDDGSWTWEEFSRVAEKLVKGNTGSKRYALNSLPPEHMLVMRVYGSYRNWVDESGRKASFQSEAFLALMEQVKGLYDNGTMTKEKTKTGDSFFLPARIYRPQDYFNELAWYKNGQVFQAPRVEGSREGMSFRVFSMMTVREKSPVKEEAWSFIRFLLSEDMQSSPNLYGIPVHRAVTAKQIEELRKSVKNGTLQVQQDIMISDGDGDPLKLPASVRVTDQDFDDLAKLIEEARYLAVSDSEVENIVYEEARAYYNGQKTALEVAKLIQNRVTTYLNE